MYYLFASAAVNTSWQPFGSGYHIVNILSGFHELLEIILCMFCSGPREETLPSMCFLCGLIPEECRFGSGTPLHKQNRSAGSGPDPCKHYYSWAQLKHQGRNTHNAQSMVPPASPFLCILSRREVGANSSAIYEAWHFCNIQNHEFQKCFQWQENTLQSGGRNLLRGFHSSKMELQRHYYSEKGVITITIKYLCF